MSLLSYKDMLEQTLSHLLGDMTDGDETIAPSLGFWIQSTQKGNHESFSPIYDTFITDIYKFVFFKVREEDASDVTSDIFIKAWEKIGSFQGEEHKFKAWLFIIAHRTVIDYYRTKKITVSLDDSLDVVNDDHHVWAPDKLLSEEMNDSLMQEALHKLPEPGKSILVMKYIQDISNEEIAQILNIHEGNMRTIAHRALKRLRELLEELRGDL